MAIRLINGAEFLHIPKTGGSWVTEMLEANGLIDRRIARKHSEFTLTLFAHRLGSSRELLKEAGRLMGERVRRRARRRLGFRSAADPYKHIFRFCFVRNPLSWYESWWKFTRNDQWDFWGSADTTIGWSVNAGLHDCADQDFNTFVRNVTRTRPGYVSELFFSFARAGISFVGKAETLREDLAYVLRLLELDFDEAQLGNAPEVNCSEDAPINWDPELRRLVMRLELPALLHFGYLSEDEARELGVGDFIPPGRACLKDGWKEPTSMRGRV
ncbi:MAG: hypothetical protein ACC655_10420 [Rhodothermia bacterium]